MVFEKLELVQFWNFYAFILVLNIFWNIFLVWPQVAPESNFYGTKNIHDKPSIAAAKREIHFFDRNENYYKNYVRGTDTEPNYEWYKNQMPYSTKNQVL